MIANIIAFIATIITLVIIEVANKGQKNYWLRIGVGIFYFGIANALNQSMRHGARGGAISAPILAEEEASLDPTDTDDSIDSERNSGEPLSATPTQRKLAVGRIVDERLMLTAKDVERISLDWKQFDNVFQLITPPPVMNPGGEVRWYLVLSPTSAVFFDEHRKQVWTVIPTGIKINLHPMSDQITGMTIHSVDGRTEKIQRVGFPTTWECIFAWISDSWEQFNKQPSNCPGWGLLAHELETGNSPISFLRWKLPYQNAPEGVSQLERQPETLAAFVRTLNPKLVKPQLGQLGMDGSHSPLFVAMHRAADRRTRNTGIAVACFSVLMAFLVTFFPYQIGTLSGGMAITIFVLIFAAAVGGAGWSEVRYRRKLTES